MKRYCLLFCVFLFSVSLGCAKSVPVEQTGFYMDTLCIFTAYGEDAAELLRACHTKMAALDASLDHRKETSTLYALNRSNGAWTALDHDAFALLSIACEMAEETGGAFDPTIGTVLTAWDDFSGLTVPTAEACREAAGLVSYKTIKLDEENLSAQLAAGQSVALGAIAKGYAADALAALYRDYACTGVISLGGNVITVGQKPDGEAFSVGIRDPRDASALISVVPLDDASAVTSGAYQRFFEKNGVTYHHIFDPETGMPADTDLLSVTVLCSSSARADALSTALFVLGYEKGRALAETLTGVRVLFVLENGELVEVTA